MKILKTPSTYISSVVNKAGEGSVDFYYKDILFKKCTKEKKKDNSALFEASLGR